MFNGPVFNNETIQSNARAVNGGGISEGLDEANALYSRLTGASFELVPSSFKGGTLYSGAPGANGDLSWTRGGDAFRTNASGLIQRVPWNLALYSQEFDNGNWAKSNATITANTTSAPDGTATADKLVDTTANANHIVFQSIDFKTISSYAISVYVKAAEITSFNIYCTNSTALNATFDLTNGTVTSVSSGGTATITASGNGWYRCSVTGVITSTGYANLQFRLVKGGITNYAGNGTDGLFIWGAQLVEGTTAQTYLPTTDRLGFPRLDYTYGATPAMLLEPQRTNLATWSNDFDNASWTKTKVSVIANQATSPDGTQNADKIYPNSSGNVFVYEMMTATTAVDKCVSFYVKAAGKNYCWLLNSSGNIGCRFDLINGTVVNTPAGNVGTISSVGNGWYKITNKDNSASNYVGIGVCDSSSTDNATVNGTDGLFIFGGQLEVGAYPTTYIQTTSASATRVADSFSRNNIYTNGLISASGGTWFVELRGNVAYTRDVFSQSLFISDSASQPISNGILFRAGSGNQQLIIFKIVGGTETTIGNLTESTTPKVAIKWDGTNVVVFINGTKIVTSSFTPTNMNFLVGNGNDVPKFIQQMALFPTPLSDTDCISLTADYTDGTSIVGDYERYVRQRSGAVENLSGVTNLIQNLK